MRRPTAILLLVLWASGAAIGQHPTRSGAMAPKEPLKQKASAGSDQREARQLFDRIAAALGSGDVKSILPDFASFVDVNITGEEPGRYSANQTASILVRYFLSRNSLPFSFSRVADATPAPYAIGPISAVQKGSRETAQVYVSLRRVGSRWRIAQFNIY